MKQEFLKTALPIEACIEDKQLKTSIEIGFMKFTTDGSGAE